MNCPACQQMGIRSETRIDYSRPNKDGTVVNRRRVCRVQSEHTFETRELRPSLRLEDTLVRRGSDHRVSGAFSRSRLSRDISDGVLKRLSTDEIASVTADVCDRLSDVLLSISEPLSADEMHERNQFGSVSSISDYQIMVAVENRLRSGSDRVAHVLYALSFRGRVDIQGREGFRDAHSFLEWFHLDEAYPDLMSAIPAQADRPVERWWPPRTPKLPSHVVKRGGSTRKFGFQQFRRSLARALHGRHNASEISRLIALMALFRLEGQPTVLASQLASEAMAALRMSDDIAFLRYAGIAKTFGSVRSFQEEAMGLIECPSPRLIFDPRTLKTPYPL